MGFRVPEKFWKSSPLEDVPTATKNFFLLCRVSEDPCQWERLNIVEIKKGLSTEIHLGDIYHANMQL